MIWFFSQVLPCLTLSEDNDTWGLTYRKVVRRPTKQVQNIHLSSQIPGHNLQSFCGLFPPCLCLLELKSGHLTSWASVSTCYPWLTTPLKTILKIIWQSDAIGNHGNHYFIIDIWCRFVDVILRFYATRLQSLWIETRYESNGKEWERRLKELRHNQSRYV